ncbi:uncharacterized protein LOC116145447 [Pistacia vera]|uniref:uncharacterized protein LOC116145447 n=1 Tax=Pistacia vera TaxID=55513 RepID=UPI001262B64D|nr:uncharacterized protein LOC116145447 [Pistacia vera]
MARGFEIERPNIDNEEVPQVHNDTSPEVPPAQQKEANLLGEPEPIKNPPSARKSKTYCRYHRDNGHHVDECQALKQAIEDLIKQGHFKEYVDGPTPVREKDQEEQGKRHRGRKGLYCVGIIFGGPYLAGNSRGSQKKYAWEAHHDPLSVMSREPRPAKIHREEEITFSEKDAIRLHHTHDDALVITLEVGWCEVHRMLVNNGSVVNILFQ